MPHTVEIQASDTGYTVWQTLSVETSNDYPGATAAEVAANVAGNQNITEPNSYNWRIRVWDGADADTGSEPDAEYRPSAACSQEDMRREVIESLASYVDNYDLDRLMEHLVRWYGCVRVNSIPFADYWSTVARFDTHPDVPVRAYAG